MLRGTWSLLLADVEWLTALSDGSVVVVWGEPKENSDPSDVDHVRSHRLSDDDDDLNKILWRFTRYSKTGKILSNITLEKSRPFKLGELIVNGQSYLALCYK